MPARALLVLLATLGALRANAAPSLSDLDRAADEFSVAIASRVLALGASTQTVHVTPLEFIGLQELLVQHLQGKERLVLLDGASAADKADLIVTGKVIDFGEGPEAFIRLTDRKSGILFLAAQRHLGAAAINNTTDTPSKRSSGLMDVLKSSAVWVVSAGALRKGKDLGWNAGIAYRSISHPWEAALEGGGYERTGSAEAGLGSNRDSLLTEASVNWVKARLDFLYLIKYVRDPFGDELFRFPGHLRLGGGLGLYDFRLKEQILQRRNTPVEQLAYSETGSHVRLLPFLDAGIVRSVGQRFEVALSAQYIISFEHFGYRNMIFGGLGVDNGKVWTGANFAWDDTVEDTDHGTVGVLGAGSCPLMTPGVLVGNTKTISWTGVDGGYYLIYRSQLGSGGGNQNSNGLYQLVTASPIQLVGTSIGVYQDTGAGPQSWHIVVPSDASGNPIGCHSEESNPTAVGLASFRAVGTSNLLPALSLGGVFVVGLSGLGLRRYRRGR